MRCGDDDADDGKDVTGAAAAGASFSCVLLYSEFSLFQSVLPCLTSCNRPCTMACSLMVLYKPRMFRY